MLKSAADALDVFDFEAMARTVLPPAHWGYMATGSDGEETLRANPAGFSRYQLRVRRFVDVSRIDTSLTLFGQTFASPIVLCPVGSQRAFHPMASWPSARAAKARNHLQILSTQSSTRIEDVVKARGDSLWYQLYTTNNFEVTTRLVQAGRGGRLPGGGGDRGFAQRPQHPDRYPRRPARLARVQQLPRRRRAAAPTAAASASSRCSRAWT